jgi:hypothetical protein
MIMRSRALLISLVAAGSMLGLASPAHAASGEVAVFSNEFEPLAVYKDPSGCHSLRPGAHQLNNGTDAPVKVYADPFCLTPLLTVQPGYGTHVPPTAGSFSD